MLLVMTKQQTPRQEPAGFYSSLYAMIADVATQDERGAEVLSRRLGVMGRPPATLHEVGLELGLSRERVRQLQSRAVSRIAIPVAVKDVFTEFVATLPYSADRPFAYGSERLSPERLVSTAGVLGVALDVHVSDVAGQSLWVRRGTGPMVRSAARRINDTLSRVVAGRRKALVDYVADGLPPHAVSRGELDRLLDQLPVRQVAGWVLLSHPAPGCPFLLALKRMLCLSESGLAWPDVWRGLQRSARRGRSGLLQHDGVPPDEVGMALCEASDELVWEEGAVLSQTPLLEASQLPPMELAWVRAIRDGIDQRRMLLEIASGLGYRENTAESCLATSPVVVPAGDGRYRLVSQSSDDAVTGGS
ncbi:MAG: sigma factor-like helix-turn-helix DNA-binding protein [Salinisphaeraceae bacterium]